MPQGSPGSGGGSCNSPQAMADQTPRYDFRTKKRRKARALGKRFPKKHKYI